MHKQQLLREIQTLDFALQDCTLFLDLHPSDEEALFHYKKIKKELIACTKEYERNYTMLSNRSVFSNDYASYARDPWPWEKIKEGC